jgi:hypothetical protein
VNVPSVDLFDLFKPSPSPFPASLPGSPWFFQALYQGTTLGRAIKAANDEGFKGVEKNRRSLDAISPEGTGQSVARHGSAG